MPDHSESIAIRQNLNHLAENEVAEFRETASYDWTAQVIPNATLNDLDGEALRVARNSFAQKHASRITADEVQAWSLETFLDRAHLTRNGKITRAALLLLGKAQSTHHLSPQPVQLIWKLDDAERAYEIFHPPFLLSALQLYQQIRNFQIKLFRERHLVPLSVPKYDRKMILEALHNCIAHQDFSQSGRIIVRLRRPNRLVFESFGSFFEGLPEEYSGWREDSRSL